MKSWDSNTFFPSYKRLDRIQLFVSDFQPTPLNYFEVNTWNYHDDWDIFKATLSVEHAKNNIEQQVTYRPVILISHLQIWITDQLTL